MKRFLFYLLGASGDLAKRKLLPGLQRINTSFPVTLSASAKEDFSDCEYLHIVESSTGTAPDFPVEYRKWDIQSENPPFEIAQKSCFYLALPPCLNIKAIHALLQRKVPLSIAIEKPYAENEEDIRQLLRLADMSDQIYFVDHYRAKHTVQNLPGMSYLKRNSISKIEIILMETQDIGQRTELFQNGGILSDMVQNHVLEILYCIFTENCEEKNIFKKNIQSAVEKAFLVSAEYEKAHADTLFYGELNIQDICVDILVMKGAKNKVCEVRYYKNLILFHLHSLTETDSPYAYERVIIDFITGKNLFSLPEEDVLFSIKFGEKLRKYTKRISKSYPLRAFSEQDILEYIKEHMPHA